MTIGERLGRYIGDHAGARMSIRAFAQAMQQRDPRPTGSTRAMVHRYLEGATPPMDFIEAAADTLGIREAWLAFGEGRPTAAEETAGATARGVAEVVEGLDASIVGTLKEAWPALRTWEAGGPLSVAVETWNRIVAALVADPGTTRVDLEGTARQVGEALHAPLAALGVDWRELSVWQVASYATLVGQALQVATLQPKLLRPMPPETTRS